jgi:hypothetical protein
VTEAPLVHVVVVDHDGGDLTLACLRSILASEWPADRLQVVLVDNASRQPVTETIARELPAVRVITSPENRGFAGGANLGMRERGDADAVALVNNDATVTPGWLTPLAAALASDPRVGAACPKILLTTPAVEVGLVARTHRRGRGDGRELGVRLSGARVDGTEVWGRTQLVDGFWGFEPMPTAEPGAQWTGATATVRVPVGPGAGAGTPEIALRLAADGPTPVAVTSGTATTALVVDREPAWHVVASDATPVDVINNVGSVIGPDGAGADRGWLEVDRGQYDEPAGVAAWCGAAVLLSRAYLDDVGLFDERLFLYYEDVELSLRGARRGWQYLTTPASVVRHVHSATSIEGSPLSFHYNERNRLLVVGSTASVPGATRAFAHHLAVTGSYALRDVASPLLHGERPHPEVVTRRLRALGAAAVRLPGMRRRPPEA